jgi:hypothetical protein
MGQARRATVSLPVPFKNCDDAPLPIAAARCGALVLVLVLVLAYIT